MSDPSSPPLLPLTPSVLLSLHRRLSWPCKEVLNNFLSSGRGDIGNKECKGEIMEAIHGKNKGATTGGDKVSVGGVIVVMLFLMSLVGVMGVVFNKASNTSYQGSGRMKERRGSPNKGDTNKGGSGKKKKKGSGNGSG